MFKLVTYDEEQIQTIFAKTPQAIESCDNCGDDLEVHKRLVVVFVLTTDDPEARHWLDPREGAPAGGDAVAIVENYEVVGCDRKARTWRLWAARKANPVSGREFMHFGDERTVRRFYATAGEPTPVELTENPDGMYWGWIDCRRDGGYSGTPVMVQPHEGMFRMQEPGGFHGRVAQGRGEVVRLSVKAVV